MTTPQGPRNEGRPPGWQRPGDQRPPAPGNPYGGRQHPIDPWAGRDQQPPGSSQPTKSFSPGNASARRPNQPPPESPMHGRSTPGATPKYESGGVPKAKKRRLRSPLSIALIVLVIVIGALIGVELYARNTANSKIATATACKVKDQATASFNLTPPVTWQYLTDHYTNITINTAGNQLQDARGMKLNLSLTDVKLDSTPDSKGTIGAIDATITWTADGIKQTVQNAIPTVGEFVTRSVTTHPADKTVELKGILNQIVAKPTVEKGGLRLEIVSFNAVGFKLPKESVQSSLDEYTTDLTTKLPLGIKADRVDVTDNDVIVHLSSRNATIPAGGNGPSDPCFANL